MKNKKCLAFFDFDGTLTTKDSLPDFIKFTIGTYKYYIGLFILSPILIAYILKLISNNTAKEKHIAFFFKGWDINKFQNIADEYSIKKIDLIIRPNAMKQLNWHQDNNHKIIIVSASLECWLKTWCKKNNIELLATQLEIKSGKITGKFSSPNCYGHEKANRVHAAYNLSQYDCIYAYGDSKGDMELLELADKRFYKPFRN